MYCLLVKHVGEHLQDLEHLLQDLQDFLVKQAGTY